MILSSTLAMPTDVHVAPLGEDQGAADGTLLRPWRSLAVAARHAISGQTIRLAPGIYHEHDVVEVRCGVNIIGQDPRTTIIRSGLPDSYLIRLYSRENQDGNQRLSGFSIDGNGQALLGGIWVENRNWVTLHSLAFRDCRDGGSVVTAYHGRPEMTEPPVYVNGIVIDDCTYTDCATVIRGPAGDVQQMKGDCQIGGIDGAILTNLSITDRTGGYGIKFIDCGYLRHVTISHCTIRVEPEAPRWLACAAIELWNVGAGCEVHHVDCNTWLSFVNVDYPAECDGINLRVHHCTLIGSCPDNGQEAIEASMPSLHIYDNHIENHGKGVAFWHTARDIKVYRNVFRNHALTPGTWGRNTPFYFDVSAGHHYRDIEVHDNICDTFVVGAYLLVQDERSELRGITIRDNRFIGIGASVCEIAGEIGRLTDIRMMGNTCSSPVPWLKASAAGHTVFVDQPESAGAPTCSSVEAISAR